MEKNSNNSAHKTKTSEPALNLGGNRKSSDTTNTTGHDTRPSATEGRKQSTGSLVVAVADVCVLVMVYMGNNVDGGACCDHFC